MRVAALVGLLGLRFHTVPPAPSIVRSFVQFCEEDFECEYPERCCDSIVFRFCCYDDGLLERVPRRFFPNTTTPLPRTPLPT